MPGYQINNRAALRLRSQVYYFPYLNAHITIIAINVTKAKEAITAIRLRSLILNGFFLSFTWIYIFLIYLCGGKKESDSFTVIGILV
jgi:hypothetical protein